MFARPRAPTLTRLLAILLRHGQCLPVYPFAFVENKTNVYPPRLLGFYDPVEDIRIATPDNVSLQAYLFRKPLHESPARRFTVIMFHGNAMDLSAMTEIAKQFAERQCNVLVLSYRGYARSTGSPTEGGLRIDAQAAFTFVENDPELAKTRIIVYGLSLGGAVAVDLVSRVQHGITALIIENTFLSLPAVVRGWPYIGWISWAVTQRWNAANRMGYVSRQVPICMMAGLRDMVVRPQHMQGLWKIAERRGLDPGETEATEGYEPTKDEFHGFAYGSHNNTFMQRGYWEKIDAFLERLATVEED